MPFFRRKKTPEPEAVAADDHAVITHLPLSGTDYGTEEEREAVHELEHRIEEAVDEPDPGSRLGRRTYVR